LGPLDAIRIDIFNVPELSGDQTVTPNGDINISLLGPVRVAGLTLGETAGFIRTRTSAIFSAPDYKCFAG
jgi:polysaccharide export outer membrane protein